MSPIEDRLKQIIAAVCEEHHAEIEELEVMPDHVQRYGERGPAIRPSSVDQAYQRALIASAPAGISCVEANIAERVDPQLLRFDHRWCPF